MVSITQPQNELSAKKATKQRSETVLKKCCELSLIKPGVVKVKIMVYDGLQWSHYQSSNWTEPTQSDAVNIRTDRHFLTQAQVDRGFGGEFGHLQPRATTSTPPSLAVYTASSNEEAAAQDPLYDPTLFSTIGIPSFQPHLPNVEASGNTDRSPVFNTRHDRPSPSPPTSTLPSPSPSSSPTQQDEHRPETTLPRIVAPPPSYMLSRTFRRKSSPRACPRKMSWRDSTGDFGSSQGTDKQGNVEDEDWHDEEREYWKTHLPVYEGPDEPEPPRGRSLQAQWKEESPTTFSTNKKRRFDL